ncbi:MAG: hypothetical protein Q9170_000723 [Blastenia crenularia]
MSVEVSLNTPLADALSNVVQPKLTEIGWNTGGLDDSALGEYIILMLVNGKTQDQIATELSNDLLSLGPDDTGATDFARWLFEQVHLLNTQIHGSTAEQTQQVSESQGDGSHQLEENQILGENGQIDPSRAPDAGMGEAMDDVQDGSIPTGPKSMRSGPRTGNKRLMGQLSKAMDRSGDAMLHRVRHQQGTERINMHNRQPPKGPRHDQNRNQRIPSNLRPTGPPNGGMPNGGMATPLMNATPQQQMALFSMLEEQARMMSQIFSPQQQNFMSGMPQPAINPNFRPGGQAHNQQPDRSLFDRIERPMQRQHGNFNKRQQQSRTESQIQNGQPTAANVNGGQDHINGDMTSSMEVESSQKSQSEQSSDTVCKFNLKCGKADCPFNPCLNPECPYKHSESQKRGTFGDKVWRADGDQEKEHVSERKFVDDNMAEELVIPENNQAHSTGVKGDRRAALVTRSQARSSYQRVPQGQRPYSTGASNQSLAEVSNVAVLGGGITGLASAYYLAKQVPEAQITLFEGTSRLGGWLRSEKVDVGNGKVIFEQGPRTLRPTRPNGWITLDLAQSLGLENQILMTSKESVAAQNRFIYFPDHLVRLPGPGTSLFSSIVSILREPLFKGLLPAALSEPLRPGPKGVDDESIASFISRRLNPAVADNLVSAMIHGIYAGDIDQLSVRSIFPSFWYAEKAVQSIGRAFGQGLSLRWYHDAVLDAEWAQAPPVTDKIKAVRESSVFTFKHGVGQLADRLESKLRQFPNVRIRQKTTVDQLQLKAINGSCAMELVARPAVGTSVEPSKESFTHIISTLSGKTLSKIVRPDSSIPTLWETPAVTVMVVNMYFSNPSVLPARGFGYLLPRSLPFEQNPERALGVVFDSDATIGQDEIPGTKVTVMLGGHWWDEWVAYPDEDMGASMAKSILRRHLGIAEEPQAIRVGLHRDCIPQYTVGHESRMARANEALHSFKGRLKVAGSSYTGVGVNDCVRSARNVVSSLLEGRHQDNGLERFAKEDEAVMMSGKDYEQMVAKLK